MEIITYFLEVFVVVFWWDINETMYLNEVWKLKSNLWIPMNCDQSTPLIVQWLRVSRGSLAMCHMPCETSSERTQSSVPPNEEKSQVGTFTFLGPSQGSGVMLLEHFRSSSSFCPSSIAFSRLMWCLCSISHNLFHLQIRRPISKNSLTQLSSDDSQISVSSPDPNPKCLLGNTV